ncbi:MAG: hypothetical protein ACR2H3_01885 [Acidimicrobiales bacterium]
MDEMVTSYFSLHGKQVMSLGAVLDESLTAEGCHRYVKTIYIGYEIDGEMVAALYGHSDHIELALALAEDDPDARLKDASHLTWRTLPVAIEVRSVTDALAANELARRAVKRILSGTHSVHRENEHFARSREGRRGSASEPGDAP